MDMKKLLGIVSGDVEKKQLNENIEECGMPMSSSPSSPGNISMNMSMNASGVDNIKQMLDLIKAASSPTRMSEPMAMPSPGMDMPISITKIKPAGDDGPRGMAQIRDLISKADSPKPFENTPEEGYADVDAVTTDAGGGPNAPKDPADIRIKDPSPYAATSEEFANEPDEEVSDHQLMIRDLSGGLNREKQQYKKEYPGDNPMAVRESSIRNQLDAMWKEIKEGRTDEWQVNLRQPYGPEFNRGFGADISQDDDVKKILAMMKPEDYIETNKFLKDYPQPEDYRERNRHSDVRRGKEHQDMYNFVQKYNRDNNNLSVAQWLEKAKNKISSAVTGKPEKKVSYTAHRFDPDAYAGGQEKHKDEVDPPQSVGVQPAMKNFKNMTQREGQIYEVDVDQPGASDNALPPPDMKPAAAPAGDDIPTINAPNFNSAYAQAVKQGLKKFKWCGTYAVKNAPAKPKAKPAINVPMEPQRRQFGGLNPNVELGPQSGSDLPIAP